MMRTCDVDAFKQHQYATAVALAATAARQQPAPRKGKAKKQLSINPLSHLLKFYRNFCTSSTKPRHRKPRRARHHGNQRTDMGRGTDTVHYTVRVPARTTLRQDHYFIKKVSIQC